MYNELLFSCRNTVYLGIEFLNKINILRRLIVWRYVIFYFNVFFILIVIYDWKIDVWFVVLNCL